MTMSCNPFERKAVSFLIAVLSAVVLAGCFPSGTREAQSFYVLEPKAPAPAAIERKSAGKENPARAGTLVVEPMTVARFYDTQSIVYSRAPGTRGYYQFASFTEPPALTLGASLEQRLEASGAFEHVVFDRRAGRDALRLRTHLQELYHDAATSPGVVRVTLVAELVDPASRALLGRRAFTQTAAAASYDAQGAVRAFNAAIGALLDEVTAWVDSTAPRP